MSVENKVEAIRRATTLEELRAALIEATEDEEAMAQIDATKLPRFGGQKPKFPQGVLSWDTERLLVSGDEPRIVQRGDWRPMLE